MSSKAQTVCFSITGEFITEQAKDFMMESDWCRAINFLKETLIGITLEQCIMILKGDAKIIGDSRNDDIGMVEVEERDEEYDEQLDFAYHNVYAPQGSTSIYRPYGYVGSNSVKDMDYSELKRKAIHNSLYYARDDRNDLAIPCEIQIDGMTKKVDVLFEKLEHQLPHWIKPNRSAQLSCDKVHFLKDESEWFRKIEKIDEEKEEGEEEGSIRSNISETLASNMKGMGMNIDSSMIDSLLGTNEEYEFKESKHEDFQSGYIDRKGKFYGCEYANHVCLAEWICKNILKIELTDDPEKDPQIILDNKGFIRLQKSAFDNDLKVFSEKKPTKAQINSLFDHSLVHGALDSRTQDEFFQRGGTTKIHIKS
jgi:hypothetical protein